MGFPWDSHGRFLIIFHWKIRRGEHPWKHIFEFRFWCVSIYVIIHMIFRMTASPQVTKWQFMGKYWNFPWESHGRFWNLFVVCRWKLAHCDTFENRFGRNKQWYSSISYAFYWILKVLTPPNLSMKNNPESPMGVPWEIDRVRCGDYFFTPRLGTRIQSPPWNISDTIWI